MLRSSAVRRFTAAAVLLAASSARAADDAEALTRKADDAAAVGDNARALALYQQALAADAEHLPAYDGLATALISEDRLGDLTARLEPVVARHPDYAGGWYNLAYAFRKQQLHEKAKAAYQTYLRLRPGDPDPYYGLGHTLKALGDAAGAVATFKRYVTLETRSTEKKWVEKARREIAELEGTLKKGEDAPSLLALADAEAKAGRCEAATPLYQRALELDPSRTGAAEALAACQTALGRHTQAAETLRSAVRDEPTFLRGWLLLARALVQAGRAAEGELAYRRYLREKPDDAEAGAEFEKLAARQPVAAAKAPATAPIPDANAILVAKPKPSASPSPTPSPDAILVAKPSPSAEAPWPVPLVPAPEGCDTIVPQQRQALTRHPTGAPAHEALLACLHQLGQWSQQEAAARAALRDAPELLRAWFFLGEALRMQGKIAEAESAYRKYVAGRAARPDGYLGLAETLRAQGEALDALASYGFYVELEERPDAQAARQRAEEQIAKLSASRRPEAPAAAPVVAPTPAPMVAVAPKPPAAPTGADCKAEVPRHRAALAKDPTDARAHDGLLACLQREGQYASVELAARVALRDAPDLAIAWFALGEALRALGRPAEAVPAYRRYLQKRPTDPDATFGVAQAERARGAKPAAAAAYRRYLELERRAAAADRVEVARLALAELEPGAAPPPSTVVAPVAVALIRELPDLASKPESKAERRAREKREREEKAAVAKAEREEKAAAAKAAKAEKAAAAQAAKAEAARLAKAEKEAKAERVVDFTKPQAGAAATPASAGPAREAAKLAPETIAAATLPAVATTRTALPPPLPPAEDCATAETKHRAALAKDPTDARAHEALLRCLHRAGRHGDAEVAARAALRDAPDAAFAWFALAEALAAQGNLDQALPAYKRYVQKRPVDPDGQFGLGEASRMRGEKPTAIAAYRRYLELERRTDRGDRIEKARAALAELGEPSPSSSAVVLPLGAGGTLADIKPLPKRKGKTSRGQRSAAASRSSTPPPATGLDLPAAPVPSVSTGDAIDALGSLPKAKPKRETRKERLARLAQAREARRAAAKAAKEAKKTEALARKQGPAPEGTPPGVVSPAKPASGAQAAASEADDAPRDEARAAALIARGDAEFQGRRYAEARALYEEAAFSDTQNAEALYRAGVCAAALGKLEDAVRAWEGALERDTAHGAARRNLDQARARLGAEGDGTIAAAVGKTRALLDAREYAAARVEIDRLLGRGGVAGALLLRAEASLGLRDGDASLRDARAALAADPSLVAAYRVMGESLRLAGETDRAAYYLEIYAERARTVGGEEERARQAAAMAKHLRRGGEW